jgi:hypothetical protein
MEVFRHQHGIDFSISCSLSLSSLHDDSDQRDDHGNQRNADREQILDSGKPCHFRKATPTVGLGACENRLRFPSGVALRRTTTRLCVLFTCTATPSARTTSTCSKRRSIRTPGFLTPTLEGSPSGQGLLNVDPLRARSSTALVDGEIVISMSAADGAPPLLLRTRMLCGARPAPCASHRGVDRSCTADRTASLSEGSSSGRPLSPTCPRWARPPTSSRSAALHFCTARVRSPGARLSRVCSHRRD